jgi:hypothetical protein
MNKLVYLFVPNEFVPNEFVIGQVVLKLLIKRLAVALILLINRLAVAMVNKTVGVIFPGLHKAYTHLENSHSAQRVLASISLSGIFFFWQFTNDSIFYEKHIHCVLYIG